MTTTTTEDPTRSPLKEELANFEQIMQVIKPSSGALPRLLGIDIAGVSLPLYGEVGGDHIIYIDFNERYDLDRRIEEMTARGDTQGTAELQQLKYKAAVLLADVSGHRVTDAVVTAMLHQAFLLGAYYELDIHGRITTSLFEHLNQRFYRTTNVNKFITMVYGEISSSGRFRFILAGHPKPLVFSRAYGRFMGIGEDRMATYPPLGMFPSGSGFSEKATASPLGVKRDYRVNTIDLLGEGDILILHTDGLAENNESYFPQGLAKTLRETGHLPAARIANRIREDLLEVTSLEDDTSFVVIKRDRSAHAQDTPAASPATAPAGAAARSGAGATKRASA